MIVKVCPYILGLIYALNSILAYFYMETTWAGYIGHLALIPALCFISQSFVLKFCIYHRMPIYYILVNDAVNTYDYFYGINITDKGLLILNIALIWITFLSIIYFYVKHHKKVIRKNT